METTLANRVLAFDPSTGVLCAEAGFSLRELTRLFYPRGWFAPVIPGTSYVTLGGMVATDVHGKNHHVAGSFGRHIRALRVRAGDRQVYECSRTENADLFWATIGGVGLTGHILEVELTLERIASPWIFEESERFGSLEQVFTALREASRESTMTVAWIDTSARGRHLGRGIVIRGRWAEPGQIEKTAPSVPPTVTVPFDFPSGIINPFTIRTLNTSWYIKHGGRSRKRFVTPYGFFWPLDAIHRWNRAFGRRGFIQYQCVLPSDLAMFRKLLDLFAKHRACSFVSVLKDAGPEDGAPLSFLQEGTTLAVDIPVRSAEDACAMTSDFNEHVLACGGRIYLAKDSYTTPDEFRRMYPRLAEFEAVRLKYDPEKRIRSALSERLFGD